MRPTELHIVLDEAYPCKRYANQQPKRPPMVVQDMTHMANFVYEFYIQRAKQLKEYYKVSSECKIDFNKLSHECNPEN